MVEGSGLDFLSSKGAIEVGISCSRATSTKIRGSLGKAGWKNASAYIEAISTNSIVFLEVPGRGNSDLATHAGLARNSKITNVITPQTKADYRSAIEYSYANRGYAVVVISEVCDYEHLLTSMSVKPKVITPGYLIRDVEPCVYDSILAERMVREAFEYAQENRDFIKGATNIVPFKDYLRLV